VLSFFTMFKSHDGQEGGKGKREGGKYGMHKLTRRKKGKEEEIVVSPSEKKGRRTR